MIPIIEKCIDHIHTVQNKPIKVHKKLSQKLETQLKKCLILHRKGKKIFFSDIDKICKQVSEKEI